MYLFLFYYLSYPTNSGIILLISKVAIWLFLNPTASMFSLIHMHYTPLFLSFHYLKRISLESSLVVSLKISIESSSFIQILNIPVSPATIRPLEKVHKQSMLVIADMFSNAFYIILIFNIIYFYQIFLILVILLFNFWVV